MSPRAKLTTLSESEFQMMNDDKGVTRPLVGLGDGAEKVDVHLNVLKPGAPAHPYHYHERAENVYIVLEGTAELIIEGTVYLVEKDGVAFIPPGVPHAAGNAGDEPLTLLEIYAPAGHDFHRLESQSE